MLDGESLVPLLRQSGGLKRDAIYWHYPHYHPGGATPYAAIRQGDVKLIHFYEDNHSEAYNLRTDPLEQHNLLATDPNDIEEALQEAVAKAFRAGYRKGRSTRR